MAGDEEEEILNWAETLNPSPTTPDKVQQLKKEILEHSKEMKILFSLMTKANHHQAALKESLRNHPLQKKNPTDLHPRVEELQKELNRLQENKAPPMSIANERLLKLQRRGIQRKRPRSKRPRPWPRKLENHPRRPDKLSRSIYKLAKHKEY